MKRSELKLENLSVTWCSDAIAQINLDMPGKSANIINDSLQDDLDRALDFIEPLVDTRGAILISGKEKIFVAGADLAAIVRTLDWPDEKIHAFCYRGQKLFNRLQELPFVTVAAIHGACVGGGLELALGCSLQIASNDKKTLLGLPETKLGLIPGWAGTVRLPRLVGLERGIDLIASSRLFGPEEAVRLGLIHSAVPREQLLNAAIQLIEASETQKLARERIAKQHAPCSENLDDRLRLSQFWSAYVAGPGGIHAYAPQILAQHMIESAEFTFEKACKSEARAMAKVYGSPASRGLLNHFYLNEHNRKNPGVVVLTRSAGKPIQRIGIVGAGVMGQAIATTFVQGKCEVKIFDTDTTHAESFVSTSKQSGLQVAERLNDLFPSDLILECITETLPAKQKLFEELIALSDSTTLLASNTSAISLEEIFSGITNGERTLGVHFCHPQLLQLVEVVRHTRSSDAAILRVVEFLQGQRKTPLVVRNAPGFVVNRILTAMIDASIGLFEEGSQVAKIDLALEDFGFLGGPFKIMDTIGLDTVVLAGRAISAQGVLQVSSSPILPMLMRKKRLGRKTKTGFYRYEEAGATAHADEEVTELLRPYQKEVTGVSAAIIQQRILSNMLVAACELLENQVVANPRDIDLAMIHGLGFPAHEGGLLFWADQQSPESIADALIWNLARRKNVCLPRRLVDWQAEKQSFYRTIDES
jgi:3-hydroxyacyl-CoA dehydrogenase/enoyl-CoA hydratase/carnithine racemase